MPTPASSWGTIVQGTSASGSSARQAMPPATSTQPAAARVAAGARTNEPATAAIGSTVTAAAAASGSTLQPLIRSNTSRKTTAVRAPGEQRQCERREQVAAGHRHALADRRRRARRAAPASAARAIGACTMKIARQSKSCVRSPPSAGPAAVPATAAPIQSRRPAPPPSSASNAAVSSAAPPSACSARITSSSSSESALAQPTDAAANSSAPAGPVARPWSAAETRQRQREHRGVDGDHRGHALDGGVELEQERRQRQRHHRRVGQDQARRDGDALVRLSAPIFIVQATLERP